MPSSEIDRLIASYRRAAYETGPDTPAASSNAAMDHLHAAFKVLRMTEEGRDAIAGLLNDADVNVRLCAAAHSLTWIPARARPVLEEIGAMSGLLGFNAQMTLREFDAGRLTFDYD